MHRARVLVEKARARRLRNPTVRETLVEYYADECEALTMGCMSVLAISMLMTGAVRMMVSGIGNFCRSLAQA